MSEGKKICEHCGASMMINEYSLNKTLLRAMVKLARNSGKKISEIGMSKGEYANVSKLKYWNFVYKTDDGLWILTEEGKRFLRGEIKATKRIGYFRDRVVERDGECTIDEVLPTEESKQKYREMMRPYLGDS